MSAQKNYLAEAYGNGIYEGAWFDTLEEAAAWIATVKNTTWTKISTREKVMAEVAKQDALLKSVGAPKIQRWVKLVDRSQ